MRCDICMGKFRQYVSKQLDWANLLSEMPDSLIWIMMSRFGDVREVLAQTWSMVYRYPVSNGVRVAVMIRTHVPSNIVVAGHKKLVSYEGQPATCYGCDEAGLV
jgi:hypothetical protein